MSSSAEVRCGECGSLVKRRELPVSAGPGPMPDKPTLECRGYSTFSWSDDPVPGRSPPTAVVLMLDMAMPGSGREFSFGLRLKSRAAVDQLIDALELHKVTVWPKKMKE